MSRILICEDNFTHRVLLQHILVSEIGILEPNIKVATDGRQTLKMLFDSVKNDPNSANVCNNPDTEIADGLSK
jgi:CheY-like chemotaxis protein